MSVFLPCQTHFIVANATYRLISISTSVFICMSLHFFVMTMTSRETCSFRLNCGRIFCPFAAENVVFTFHRIQLKDFIVICITLSTIFVHPLDANAMRRLRDVFIYRKYVKYNVEFEYFNYVFLSC